MWSKPFRTAFASLSSKPPTSSPSAVQACKPSPPSPQKDPPTFSIWQCSACGRRYVDPSPASLIINPPPTTPCIQNHVEKTGCHIDGDSTKLIISEGATCDYHRVSHTGCDFNDDEHFTDSKNSALASDKAIVGGFPARDSSAKPVGEHGRVSRGHTAEDWTYEEDEDKDDDEECEFWNGVCEDVDCVSRKRHFRHQCALAELDEEPKAEGCVSKRALKFRWSMK